MERVYTDYTASGRQVVLNNVPATFAQMTVENLRLIFNETQKDEDGEAIDPLVSTGAKENVQSIAYNASAHTITIILGSKVPTIASGDKLTIKVDMGDTLSDMDSTLSSLAKQGSNPNATNTAILSAIPNIPTDYAKQGNNPDATNAAIFAAVNALSVALDENDMDDIFAEEE